MVQTTTGVIQITAGMLQITSGMIQITTGQWVGWIAALLYPLLRVLGLILAQFAIGVLVSVIKLVLILIAFAALAFVGLYLWRRGDI